VIVHGDCLDVMATLEPESVSAIVTDPPYGLGFMGKAWDGTAGPGGLGDMPMRRTAGTNIVNTGVSRQGGRQRSTDDFAKRQARDARSFQAWCETWAEAAFRVAKPGAHLLSFGGTRTVHRMASGLEDAGWEIRDCLVWGYASGFPKSLDVAKAIDKSAGHWRGRAGEVVVADQPAKGTEYERSDKGEPVTAAAAAAAAGWGTALKPAWEPIVMARKPLRGTVAANWQEHGTGALNIDASRIGTEARLNPAMGSPATSYGGFGVGVGVGVEGRWPANVILTDPIFDGDVDGVVGGGYTESGEAHVLRRGGTTGVGMGFGSSAAGDVTNATYGDSGTYSRFFLIPKSARSEREPIAGMIDPRQDKAHRRTGVVDNPRLRGETFRANFHPTVKPVDLMRHLVRLVTPSGGIVLDPFLGSGTTGIACEMEGFEWIGIEREAEYVAIAEARLVGVQKGFGLSA
jgi:DNA modification methylase